MNILILDGGTPHTLHSGKIVVLANAIKELSKYHRLHYVYAPEPGENFDLHESIRKYVQSVTILPLEFRSSVFGRIRSWFSWMPWFFAEWRFPEDWKKAREIIKNICERECIDVMDCYDYQAMQYALDLGMPVVNDQGDSLTLHLRRERAQSTGWKKAIWLWMLEKRMNVYENMVMKKTEASIFLSAADASVYVKQNPYYKICVVANGVDTEYFSPGSDVSKAAGPILLFTGHMSYPPNVNAALYLCESILPRVRLKIPTAQVVIAGADPTPEIKSKHNGNSIVITSRVPDLRPYFREAAVYVCPMRMGAGIKNKLLEAMAMGNAIVATSLAVQALSVTPGKELLVEDNPDRMADEIVRLVRLPEVRKTLGQNARRCVEEVYQWPAIGEQRSGLLQQAVVDFDRRRSGMKMNVKRLAGQMSAISIARNMNQHKVAILMYHALHERTDAFFPGVSRETFLKQMMYVKKHYHVLPLDRIIYAWENHQALPKKTLVVTFDDGHSSIWKYAFPVLKQLEIPAVLYVATGAVDKQEPIWTDLVVWFFKLTEKKEYDFKLNGQPAIWSLRSVRQRIAAARSITSTCKKMANTERLIALTRLEGELEVKRFTIPSDWMMSWEQIKELDRGNIEIGAHTVHHPILSRLSSEEARREILDSKRFVESILGKPVYHFAYPNGEPADFTEKNKELVMQAGYRSACTTVLGFNTKHADRYALKRIYAREEPLEIFAARLAGLGS